VGVISTPSLFVASAVVALVGFLIYWGTSHAFVAIVGLFILGFGVSLFSSARFRPRNRVTTALRCSTLGSAAATALLTTASLLDLGRTRRWHPGRTARAAGRSR